MAAVTTTGAFAQAGEADHDHGADGHIVCGTRLFNDGGEAEALARTRANNPELYERLVERAKHPVDMRALLSAAGDEDFIFPFVVRNRVTGQYEDIQAKLAFHGMWARIWVDTRDTGKSRVKNAIAVLARGLDTATATGSRNPGKGIVENDIEVFGVPPVNRFDPSSQVQDFLLTDIQDGLSSGFVGGFFSSWDQTDQPGSNKMNILYIDANEGLNQGSKAVLSTLAHEFQHLIHYRTDPTSQTLYNEGCSEVASILLGYMDRSNSKYLRDVNVSLFKWNFDDKTGNLLEIDYERAMTLMHYLTEQYGEEFLTQFVKTQTENMDRIAEALTAVGREPNWQEALSGYAVANYIGKDYPDSRFVYRQRLSTATPGAAATFDGSGELPGTNALPVQQYASAYVVYTNPGGLKFNFKSSSQPYKVMAMLYKGSPTPVQVTEMAPGQDYTFAYNGSAPYDKIVLAIVNHSFNSHSVNWTVERVTLGVDDEAVAGGLAVASIAPNPSSGSATMTFTNARVGNVSVELYNTAGEMVRTVVADRRLEAGEHQVTIPTGDLPNGLYMVRLTQDGGITSRTLMVLNK